MNRLTMGEATQAAQGYATQVWIPTEPTRATRDIVALLHNRSGLAEQPGIFFMPGNRVGRLFTPGAEEQAVRIGRAVQQLRIPNPALWSNHGGPCTRNGAEYHKVGSRVFAETIGAYVASRTVPVVIEGKYLGTDVDFMGPYDYQLPTGGRGILSGRPKFFPMDKSLAKRSR